MKRGFSLLELLFATVIGGAFLALAQTPFLSTVDQLEGQLSNAEQQRQIDRFLLMLKTEVVQSGYGLGPSPAPVLVEPTELTLRVDLNLDADLNDTREEIGYRFDADGTLRRRSGRGSFQPLITGLHSLEFQQGQGRQLPESPPQSCVQVKVQPNARLSPRTYTLCPLFL